MTLSEYLKKYGITATAFATRLGVTRARVSQLVAGGTPSVRLAQRVLVETNGLVTLQDWPAGKANDD